MGLLDCLFCERRKATGTPPTKRQSKTDTILSASGKTTSSEAEKNDPERERVARGWESEPEDEDIARKIKERTQAAQPGHHHHNHQGQAGGMGGEQGQGLGGEDEGELVPDGMGYRYKVSATAT